MLGVAPLAPARVHVSVGRQREGRPAYDVTHDLAPGGLEGRGVRGNRARERPVHLVRGEQLPRVGPEIVQRSLDPPMTLAGAVAQPEHPLPAVAKMVPRLL